MKQALLFCLLILSKQFYAQHQPNSVVDNTYELKQRTNDSENITSLSFKTNSTGEITTIMLFMGKKITKKNPFTYSINKSVLTYTYTIDGDVYNENIDILNDQLISRDYVGFGDKKLIYRKVVG